MSSQSQLPDLNIKISDRDLVAAAQLDILAVTVHEDLDVPSMFAIQLYNWDPYKLQVTWSDDQRFAPGSKVEIWMGYIDALDKVMVGEITSLEPAFPADDVAQVTVRGYDRRHRLLRRRQTQSFAKMTDSAIASKVAQDAGLLAKVQDSKVTLEYVLQHNQTDLAFLQERARRIGYEVFVKEKTLYFQPRQHAAKATVTLSLTSEIIDFYPRLTTMSQVGEVAIQGWDPKAKQALLGKAATGSESTTMGSKTSGPKSAHQAFGTTSKPWARVQSSVTTKAEADSMAQGQFDAMALTYIEGEATCYGRTDLRAGDVVEIADAGKLFSGLYYIASAIHTISPAKGYQTRLKVWRNAT